MFNGRINPLNTTLYNLFRNVGGFHRPFKLNLIRRFELTAHYKTLHTSLDFYAKPILRAINLLLSQVSTVNNQVAELNYFTTLRLYLIKSFRGKAHALGKPVKGQRTWSNA